MELNKEASNAYSVIKTDIGQIAEINKRVSSEVNEQFIATEETKNNISSITNLADTNADSLNAIKNQIELQANERNSLNNLVGFFKV